MKSIVDCDEISTFPLWGGAKKVDDLRLCAHGIGLSHAVEVEEYLRSRAVTQIIKGMVAGGLIVCQGNQD